MTMPDKNQTEDIYTPRQLSLSFTSPKTASDPGPPCVKRYLFVDLETGGLYPDKHAVLQVAAIITDFDFNVKGQFMSYIQPHPELEITKEALMINQLSLEGLQLAPIEKSVALALS